MSFVILQGLRSRKLISQGFGDPILVAGSGSALADSQASATGTGLVPAVGTALGNSQATALGTALAGAFGSALANSQATALGTALVPTVGLATGSSRARGIGYAVIILPRFPNYIVSTNMIAIGSDNVMTLSGLFDSLTSGFVGGATVVGALKQGTTTVYSFPMPVQSNSNGTYLGLIPFSVSNTLSADTRYSIQVDAVTSGGNYFRKSNSYIAEVASDS